VTNCGNGVPASWTADSDHSKCAVQSSVIVRSGGHTQLARWRPATAASSSCCKEPTTTLARSYDGNDGDGEEYVMANGGGLAVYTSVIVATSSGAQ